MKIGILVDSSATANPAIFADTFVECLPLHLTHNAETDILDTSENLEKYQVYEKMQQGEVWKTSQASPGEVSKKYFEMLQKYEHVIHIPITENLSSMLGTALLVAREPQFEGKVTVIRNTALAAQAIAIMAMHLSALIKDGTLQTPQMVVDQFDKVRDLFYIAIIPGDLKSLSAGGRATKIASSILNIFKTKVLIRWQEKPDKVALSRTIGTLTEKVIQQIQEHYQNHASELILTSVPQKYGEKNLLSAKHTLDEEKITYHWEVIPHLYPVHAGLGTIGFISYPSGLKIK